MHLCAVYCQSPYVYPRQDCGEDSVINMSVSRRKGVKAWVLYWEVQPGGPAPIARDHEVVAVLPPNWGEDRVFFYAKGVHLTSVPAIWTSLSAIDPFVAVAAGRSPFRIDDLLELLTRKSRELSSRVENM